MELVKDWLYCQKSRIIIFLIRIGWRTPSCLGCSRERYNNEFCNRCRSVANGFKCFKN